MVSHRRPSYNMGLIRPNGTGRGGVGNKVWLSIPSVLVGFLFGSLFAFLLMLPLSENKSSFRSTASTPDQQGGMNPSLVDVDAVLAGSKSSTSSSTRGSYKLLPGWHSIHVFFGNREQGLHTAPGQEWFSQVHQDETVVDLLGNNGYFIDLAANDAKEFSNTLALEKHGWDGLCVEPNPTYWYGLSHRKCTVVGALVGGPDIAQVHVKFRGVFGGILGKMDEKLANRKKEPDAAVEKRFTAPFVDILRQFEVPAVIDYMSLDVEGAEYQIMEHFPFDRYIIKVMTIERPSEKLKNLLESHGYIFLRSLAWWGETLWGHKSTGLTPDHPKIAKIVEEGK